MLTLTEVEQKIVSLITLRETGSGTTGVGISLNNPGALQYATWEANYQATESPSGFAQFPTQALGNAAALDRVNQLVSAGDSESQLLETWAPTATNPTTPARIAEMAQATGLAPTLSIK